MNGICTTSAPDAADRAGVSLLKPAQDTREALQIEALHYEFCHLEHPNLASRGLNRPCELNELMARAA